MFTMLTMTKIRSVSQSERAEIEQLLQQQQIRYVLKEKKHSTTHAPSAEKTYLLYTAPKHADLAICLIENHFAKDL